MQKGGGFSRSVIAGLEEKNLVRLEDREVMRDPFQGGDDAPPPDLTPTPDQRVVLDGLLDLLQEKVPTPVLLHGITGSGKTLVYIEILREVVEQRGRSAIVLVPEISLTPQTVSRFRAHFGDAVAVLHSGLSDGERYDAWRQLRSGEKRIAVGARSAIFAPMDDLGAVIVDEEHEGTYKQSEAPRYHGRDLAVVRAAQAGALCVLGSATPSLESWSNAQAGKYCLFSLPERATGQPLPPVSVVDLRAHRDKKDRAAHDRVLSPSLVAAVKVRLERQEQIILLLNRRGYSSFVQCGECGDVRICPHCSISLTFHRVSRRILCHHCRYEEPAPDRCTRCGSTDLSFRGLGTEQVERVVNETFPTARVARMDVGCGERRHWNPPPGLSGERAVIPASESGGRTYRTGPPGRGGHHPDGHAGPLRDPACGGARLPGVREAGAEGAGGAHLPTPREAGERRGEQPGREPSRPGGRTGCRVAQGLDPAAGDRCGGCGTGSGPHRTPSRSVALALPVPGALVV